MSIITQIATGYDFEPLPDGVSLPIVAEATSICMEHGKDAMLDFYETRLG